MSDPLQAAREVAGAVRFSQDEVSSETGIPFRNAQATQIRNDSLHNGIAVSEAVVPKVAGAFRLASEALRIPDGAVEGYVFPHRTIQAICIQATEARCLVRVSSEACNLLSLEELAFVVGHELGHFLLGHTKEPVAEPSLAWLGQQRFQELSADRVGRLACGALDMGLRAMMMTATGLSREELRFDAVAHVGQIGEVDPEYDIGLERSTHPPILLRSRALVRFESALQDGGKKALSRVDSQVAAELDRYVGRWARERADGLRRDLAMWQALREATKDGVFDRAEQRAFGKRFGTENLEKVKNLLRNMSPADFREFLSGKVAETKRELAALSGGG